MKFKRMAIYLFLVFGVCILALISYGIYLSEPGYTGPVTDHFDGKRFFNPNGEKGNSFGDVLKWGFSRKRGVWMDNYESYVHSDSIEHHTGSGVKILFVNHSTFLIQMDGMNILTDPVWSERASPLSWSGPKRYRKPGVAFDLLPKIDLVLISHNHYDHLDIVTLKKLQKLHNPTFIVPLGVDKILFKNGINNVRQLDWHQLTVFENLKISATPAIHFSARGILDRDNTLWSGFMLQGSKTIYFAGDTAYDQVLFQNIGKKYPAIDLAMIPVGAYKPGWFMSSIHTNPEEAIKIHIDIKAKKSIGCHFGTFELADEGVEDVPKDLKKALNNLNVREKDFFLPDEGVFYTF